MSGCILAHGTMPTVPRPPRLIFGPSRGSSYLDARAKREIVIEIRVGGLNTSIFAGFAGPNKKNTTG